MSRREKNIMSLLGKVHLQRAYYHCRHCRSGYVPLDQEVGLSASHLTPAAAEVTCLAGVQTSFAEASEVTLQKMCGLRLSESTPRTHNGSDRRASGGAVGRRRNLCRDGALGVATRCQRTNGCLREWRRHGHSSAKRAGSEGRGTDGLGRHALQSARGLLDAPEADGLDPASSPIFSGVL